MFVRDEDSEESKLSLKTLGPFRVISNDGNTITVDYDGVHQRLNSDRVVLVPKLDASVKPKRRSRASALPAAAHVRESSLPQSEVSDAERED